VFLGELVTKGLWTAALEHGADVPPDLQHRWWAAVWIIMHTAKTMWRLCDQSVIYVKWHRERDRRP
jgi:predicted benzoate:H+ symporter BenE